MHATCKRFFSLPVLSLFAAALISFRLDAVTAFSVSNSKQQQKRIFVGTPTPNHPERTVADCMSTITTVQLTPSQSADEAIASLLSNHLAAAPVINPENKKQLVGIVTSYDFLQREAFEGAVVPLDSSDGPENVESYAAAARKICARRVSDVMTENPQTVEPSVGMRVVAAKMARHS